MMNNLSKQSEMFNIMTLKPKWGQFIINELPLLLLEASSIWCFLAVNSLLGRLAMLFSLCLLAFLIYKAAYIKSIVYYITGEQIIYQHGIFNVTTEYLELYRVIDYQQKRSLLEQLFCMKTVIIISGDKTLPTLKIIGIDNTNDIVPVIRERVEINKKRRGVYEITNRY